MTNPSALKTIGLTPALYCSNQAVFHVTRGVPLGEAMCMASDFLSLAKSLSEDAACDRESDRHAWAGYGAVRCGVMVSLCGGNRSDLSLGRPVKLVVIIILVLNFFLIKNVLFQRFFRLLRQQEFLATLGDSSPQILTLFRAVEHLGDAIDFFCHGILQRIGYRPIVRAFGG